MFLEFEWSDFRSQLYLFYDSQLLNFHLVSMYSHNRYRRLVKYKMEKVCLIAKILVFKVWSKYQTTLSSFQTLFQSFYLGVFEYRTKLLFQIFRSNLVAVLGSLKTGNNQFYFFILMLALPREYLFDHHLCMLPKLQSWHRIKSRLRWQGFIPMPYSEPNRIFVGRIRKRLLGSQYDTHCSILCSQLCGYIFK